MKIKTVLSDFNLAPNQPNDIFEEEIILEFGFTLGMNVFRAMANDMLAKFDSLATHTDKEIEDYFEFELYFTVANILLFYGVCPKVLTQFIALRLSDIRSSLSNPKYSEREFKEKLFVPSKYGRNTNDERNFHIANQVYQLCIAEGITVAESKKRVRKSISPALGLEGFNSAWKYGQEKWKDLHKIYSDILES